MDIIIPANRVEGDINSQVIVDNEVSKVVVKNYIVTKKTSEQADDVIAKTLDYADNNFGARNYYTSDKALTYDFRRIETCYTKGYVEAQIDKNIGAITKSYAVVSGKKTNGIMSGNHTTMENPTNKKSWWTNPNADTYLASNFVTITKREDFSDKKLSPPNFKKTTLPDDTYINIKSITVKGSSYILGIEFNILTGTRQYIYRSPNIFGIDDKHSFEEYAGNSFTIKLDISTVDVETKDNLSINYGEGSKILSYNSNELFQLVNTYNDGEKEVPISEFVANQVLGIYKNGRKTATMTTLTDNLIVSDNKLKDGHYGVRGRLERKIYKVGDSVIPYKIDTSLKELPNSEFLGIPQSFKVVENEVKYEGKLTQILKTQEDTYFNVEYDEDLLNVYENNILVGSGDRIFREEEITIQPKIEYSDDYVVFLDINKITHRLNKDTEDATKYNSVSKKVNGFITLDLTAKQFVTISSGEVEETITWGDFSKEDYFGLVYNKPLTNFIGNALHRVSITTITESKLADFFPEAYPPYEETQIVISGDEGHKATTRVGKEKTIQVDFYFPDENTISITYTNSAVEKLTYIKINSVAQVES